ncbi:MAG: hypothetical protein ACQEXJ_23335 [Myxococcota bacterium]
MRSSLAKILAAVAVAWSVSALAPHAAAVDWDVEPHGWLRYRHVQMSDFPLGPAGPDHGQAVRDLLRLAGGGTLYLTREFWGRVTVEVADGQILGNDSPVTGDYPGTFFRNVPLRDQVFLREGLIQVPIGLGVVKVGRMPLHWGMGLVVNDGEGRDAPFAESYGGDIVNGVHADVLPLLPFIRGRAAHAVRLRLDVGLIERDEWTDRLDGDVGARFGGALLWEEPNLEAGLLAVRRNIRRDGGDQIVQSVVDLAARWRRALSERWTLEVSAEVAAMSGHTNLETSDDGEEAPEGRISGYGAAARLAFVEEREAGDVVWSLETGVASGDDTPLDGRDESFRFDPAHEVGMILFGDVLSRVSARGHRDLARRVDDPRDARRTGVQPTAGGVRGAAYLAPDVRATFCHGCLELRLGSVLAVTTEEMVDPAAAWAGEPASWYGDEPRGGLLGWEVDAGASLGLPLETPRMSVGSDYGVFVPGAALDGPGDEDGPGVVHQWRVRADIGW